MKLAMVRGRMLGGLRGFLGSAFGLWSFACRVATDKKRKDLRLRQVLLCAGLSGGDREKGPMLLRLKIHGFCGLASCNSHTPLHRTHEAVWLFRVST